mgnify:CR=1 FL=1
MASASPADHSMEAASPANAAAAPIKRIAHRIDAAYHGPVDPPRACRPAAYALFAANARDLDAPGALLRCAVAISMHELADATPELVEASIDALGARVRAKVTSRRSEAYLAWLHAVLFEEEGVRGDTEHYHDPFNSYLPKVLERRRGLPITLTLLYREVAARVGLGVEGINAPGHFLARVEVVGGPLLLDPFFAGRALTPAEALRRIEEVTGRPVPHDRSILVPATPAQWLARMLQNLLNSFIAAGRKRDVAAMFELGQALDRAAR